MNGGIGKETNIQTTGDKLKQGAAFVGLRYFDNALWLGAAASGIFMQEKTGIPSEVVAPAIAVGVTGIEYTVSGQAVKVFGTDKSGLDESKLENTSSLVKDTLALGYSAWSGSTSTVEFNNSLGLESSKTRRLGQAAIYGIGCSLWTTNLPLFKQGRELVLAGAQEWIENPIEGTAAAGAVSLGVFSLFKGIKVARQKFSEYRLNKAQENNA